MEQKNLTSKNIVIFSDGTGQKGGEGVNTNVYHIYNMIENRTPRQIAYYDSGIGSGRRDKLKGLTGRGFSKNILDCYKFLFDNYESNDKVYLFGFSRGAATVRSLAGFVNMFGVLPKSRDDLIKKAYKIYKITDKKERKTMADNFIGRHHTMGCDIKFIGVWDTVAALGAPTPILDKLINLFPYTKHKFHDLGLGESVQHARHALANHENRKTFKPEIWDTKLCKKDQTLKQVWFTGVHTDVGGGYAEKGLSDIALEWMLDEAKPHGLLIYGKNRVITCPDVNGKMHDHNHGVNRWLSKADRSWPYDTHGTPDVHQSVIDRAEHNNYNPWITQNKQGYNIVK